MHSILLLTVTLFIHYHHRLAFSRVQVSAFRILLLIGACFTKARPSLEKQPVLVHGASGGCGIAAVQFAKIHGMTVIGTAGTDEGMECVKKAGAHFVLNHRHTNYMKQIIEIANGGAGPDLIFENAAHVNLGNDLEILSPSGRVIIVGGRKPIQINPRDTMRNESSVTGLNLFRASEEELKESHAAIQAGMEAGWLRPIVGKEFSLSQASAAHEEIINRHGAIGKMVLNVDEN